MVPGRHSLVIYRGDSYRRYFGLWWDRRNTVPVDLSETTARAQIRIEPGSVPPTDFGIAVAHLPNVIEATLSPAQTEALPDTGMWDIELTSPDGSVTTLLRGYVTVSGDITRNGGRRMGVTDGSNALPGEIGEFIEFTPTFSYPGSTSTWTANIGTLPAGAWLMQVAAQTSTACSVNMALSPQPMGFWGDFSVATEGRWEYVALSVMNYASTAGPTLLNFTITTTPDPPGPTGTVQFFFKALRIR